MLHQARIVSFDDRPSLPSGHQSKGWLCVEHKGEIRWARPCFGVGSYRPPSDLWVKKNAEKFGVWVTEESENGDDPASHLVYLGFIPLEDGLDSADLADFPEKSVQSWDRYKWREDSRDSERTLTLYYTGWADDSDAPQGGEQPVLQIRQQSGSETIELIHVQNGQQSGSKLSFQPSKNFELEIDGGAGLKLEGKDDAAVLKVGSAGFNLAVFQAIQTWWDAPGGPAAIFNAHIHPTPGGPSSAPSPGFSFSAFPSNAKSTKALVPNG